MDEKKLYILGDAVHQKLENMGVSNVVQACDIKLGHRTKTSIVYNQ